MIAPQSFINRHVGTKYLVGGSGPEGMDCYGLVFAWFRDVKGIILPMWAWDGTPRMGARMMVEARKKQFREIEQPEDGCIVAVINTKLPHHVGIYYKGSVIHSARSHGVILESMSRFKLSNPNLIFGVLDAG